MRQKTKKMIAVGLCAILCLSGTVMAFAKTEGNQKKAEAEKKEEVSGQEDTGEQKDIAKDETVYVLAGADGTVKKIIVSDWIKNGANSDTLEDQSELSDIENVKGDESYTLNGEHMKVWDAQGNDIYYQGNLEKELPVGLTVSYKLDGERMSPGEMAGKSGRAVIRFDYENRQYEMADIDGQEEKIYVPFAMLTGMMLDNDVFHNVEVSNGKMLNDGDHTIVAGIAFPGLQENLNVSAEKTVFPDFVEITADVENFAFGMTVTVATNEIFSELDQSEIGSLDDMTGSMDQLTDAMAQLLDGSSALYDGLNTLLEKSGELVAGVDQLAEGARTIREGADSLDEGAAALKAGLADLSSGLNELASNSETLNQGAEAVFKTLLSTAENQLKGAGISVPSLTIENYAQVLDSVIDSLNENAVHSDTMESETVQSQPVSEGAKTIISLKTSLDSYNAFYLGLSSYTEGVDDAAEGAEQLSFGAVQLKDGTAQLKEGADTLYQGALTLKDGMPALTDGVTQLRDGSMALSDGLKQLNEEGIQKLVQFVDGDLSDISVRLKATIDVSKNYKNFAGKMEDMDGQVKFIYRTDEIAGQK